jgi:hypothetical protein
VEDGVTNLLQGYWCEWIPRCPCHRPARPKGLSCQRVRNHAEYPFVGANKSRRTVRGARLAANQEIFQKTYGSAVEIVAIDDLLEGDFTAALQSEGESNFSCSAAYLHPFEVSTP